MSKLGLGSCAAMAMAIAPGLVVVTPLCAPAAAVNSPTIPEAQAVVTPAAPAAIALRGSGRLEFRLQLAGTEETFAQVYAEHLRVTTSHQPLLPPVPPIPVSPVTAVPRVTPSSPPPVSPSTLPQPAVSQPAVSQPAVSQPTVPPSTLPQPAVSQPTAAAQQTGTAQAPGTVQPLAPAEHRPAPMAHPVNQALLSLYGPVALDGRDIADAWVETAPAIALNSRQPVPVAPSAQIPTILVKFTPQGSQKFAQATQLLAGTGLTLGIFLDGHLVSAPTVAADYAESGVTGGIASINGGFTLPEAVVLVQQLKK